MIITKKNRYLNIPTNPKAERQKLRLFEGETLLLDLDVQLDLENPKYIFYYDLHEFMGREIFVKSDSVSNFVFSCEKESHPDNPLRPKLHFTAEYGMINDPNGLVFYEGKYHLFFQHNAAGNIMANMHWGHAISEDLISWEQLPYAVAPDNMGDAWSGSAIVDSKNLLGMNTPEHEALILFYTASGNMREVSANREFAQCIAVSTDGGYTFRKYENNPVVKHIKGSNRDPKVIYHKESDMYVMVLYIDGSEFALLRSANLLDWEQIQTFAPGYTIECPDLFFTYDNGIKKWVFAGGNSTFMVCDFDINEGLINITNKGRYAFGRIYAGQTWSNISDRILRVDVQKTRELPTEYFNSFLTLPYEVYLKDNDLRLKLAREIEDSVKPYSKSGNIILDGFSTELPDYSLHIKLTLSDIEDIVTLKLFETEIIVDTNLMQIRFEDVTMPCYIENGKVELTLIADRICFEIFSSDRFVGGKGIIHVGREKCLEFKGKGNIEIMKIALLGD